ncbi:ABC transporter ATP-binding protein/permease [Streptomyces sp. 4503]|uniref:ABC transporter ATP-binding protein/permease n=1 Tax=Streptomyces niphimycinicus TaxID=2842201 RepID=A0ABS6CL83_9ACTN|nr:ABC transporter ATP-binding protein [Streptomyces niphimycinicus]MBU3867677.1 ABC transporter ATP-binding protein/permease [Streptomyces niphimycinicus]
MSSRITGEQRSATATLRRAFEVSPGLREGLLAVAFLALLAAAGRVVVPIAVQITLDEGLTADEGPRTGFVLTTVGVCAVAVLATAWVTYRMNYRLYRSTEAGLATLRVKAFRRVHDLSASALGAERRGDLVARVTADVDQFSTFLQFGGMFLVSLCQLGVGSVVMFVYSWQLALMVWVLFIPLALVLPALQRRLSRAYGRVRARGGDMLAATGEAVVGAAVIHAYNAGDLIGRRIDTAVEEHRRAQSRAQRLVAVTLSSGEVAAALAIGGVVSLGVLLGVGGQLTAGELVAFLFLVTLFIGPAQMSTEVLNELQNALAGWRRALAVVDTPIDVADPGPAGTALERGPVEVRFEDVGYAYPDGPQALHEVSVHIEPRSRVAVVGETGSGKSTFAKLLIRLADPTSGRVALGGVPLTDVPFASLRERVVMVPQDGFLFDTTIGENIVYGRPGATADDVERALHELGLEDWLAGLARGLDTPVGQRGEALSAGERQLVALARAYLADPDLLVLDEATSAVDPATEQRLQRALESAMRGRTAVSVAHRLSTAEAADRVLVFDGGRIVQQGSHDELIAQPGRYAKLYEAWMTATGTAGTR